MTNPLSSNKFILTTLVMTIILVGLSYNNLPGPPTSFSVQTVDGIRFDLADYHTLTHEQLAIFNYFDSFITAHSYNSFEGWNAEGYEGYLHYMLAFTSYVFESMFETTPGYRTNAYRNFSYALIKKMNTTTADYGNDSIEHVEWEKFHYPDYYYPNASDDSGLFMGGFRGPANIMWTGHYALMELLYERNFNTGEMLEEINWFLSDWNNSLLTDGYGNPQEGGIWKTGLIPCEPYIVFVQCNSIPLFLTELYDNMYQTSWMESGMWDYYLDFIEVNMTDEYGLYIDGYFVQEPLGLIPNPDSEPQQIPGPAINSELGLPRVNSYGLAWALTFLEYTIPEVTIPDYPVFLDVYGKELAGDMLLILGSHRSPKAFGDINGMLGNFFGSLLANQRGDFATRDRILRFLQSPYNKAWSVDERSMHYDTSSIAPFLAPVLSGFSVWSTLPVTVRDLADPRPPEFWSYPYISAADDDHIWVYQAEWDSVKQGFILNIQVDQTATLTFSNFGAAPTAYSGGAALADLTASGGDYILTLQPGSYHLVIK